MTRPLDPRRATSLTRTRAMRPTNDNGTDACEAKRVLAASAIALAGGRGATVPLDPELHMRLRLACALTGRSAQAILADALDDYLKTVPGIERLMAASMGEGGDQAAAGWGSDT